MKRVLCTAAMLLLSGSVAFATAPAHHTTKMAAHHTTKMAAHHTTKMASHTKTTKLRQVLTCPVMGSAIASPKMSVGYSDYKGARYYFCCKGCKPAFDKNPAMYVAKMKKAK